MSDEQEFPTIMLPRGAKPWKAGAEDDARPILWDGWLRRHKEGWWLLTSDSFIACALKVETTGEPVEGRVPRGILKMMYRSSTVAAQLEGGVWRVQTAAGEWTLRPRNQYGAFPDLAALGMWDEPGDVVTAEIGLDPRLTSRLREAMGSHEVGVCLRFTGKGAAAGTSGDPALSPILVTPMSDPGDRRGLQMPVWLS